MINILQGGGKYYLLHYPAVYRILHRFMTNYHSIKIIHSVSYIQNIEEKYGNDISPMNTPYEKIIFTLYESHSVTYHRDDDTR